MTRLASSTVTLILFLLLAFPAAAQYAGDISNATTTLADPSVPPPLTRSVVGRLSDSTQATDFCNASESSAGTDATPCLQRAVNALCARSKGGGTLFVPAGQYRIDGTVTVGCSGISIVGSGVGDPDQLSAATKFIASSTVHPTWPVFQANVTTGPGAPVNSGRWAIGFSMRDLQIYNGDTSPTVFRSGPFIEVDHFWQVTIDNVFLYAACNALKFDGGIHIHVSKSYISGTKPNCDTILLTGNHSTSYNKLDDVSFSRVIVSTGAEGNCWNIKDRVQTVWWTNTTCETLGHSLVSSCPTMDSSLYCPGFYSMYDFESEYLGTSGGNMIEITDLVDGFKMTDSWLRGSANGHFSNNLVSIIPLRFPANSSCSDYATCAGNLNVNITSSWFKFSGGDCLRIQSAMISIIGNQIYGCNAFNVGGGAYGVDILASRAIVSNNQFCGGDWLHDINWQMSGVGIQPAADYVNVSGNIFSGDVNVTVPAHNGCAYAVVNASSGFHTIVATNIGP